MIDLDKNIAIPEEDLRPIIDSLVNKTEKTVSKRLVSGSKDTVTSFSESPTEISLPITIGSFIQVKKPTKARRSGLTPTTPEVWAVPGIPLKVCHINILKESLSEIDLSGLTGDKNSTEVMLCDFPNNQWSYGVYVDYSNIQ